MTLKILHIYFFHTWISQCQLDLDFTQHIFNHCVCILHSVHKRQTLKYCLCDLTNNSCRILCVQHIKTHQRNKKYVNRELGLSLACSRPLNNPNIAVSHKFPSRWLHHQQTHANVSSINVEISKESWFV